MIYFFKTFLISGILLLNMLGLSAQNKSSSKAPFYKINYSKYIGKTVEYFFSDFKLPIKDTISIRDYGFIP